MGLLLGEGDACVANAPPKSATGFGILFRWYSNADIQDEILKHLDPTDKYDLEVAALYNMHHRHHSQNNDSLEEPQSQPEFEYMSDDYILKMYGNISEQEFDIDGGHIFIMIHIQVK